MRLVHATLDRLHARGPGVLLGALEAEGKEAVLRLLLLLVSRLERGDALLHEGRRLLPCLLAVYRGSLAAADQLVLRLLWILADGGLRLGLGWFRLGVSPEEVDWAMEQGKHRGRLEREAGAWLLEWVDPERVFLSLESFPLARPLFPPPLEPWEATGADGASAAAAATAAAATAAAAAATAAAGAEAGRIAEVRPGHGENGYDPAFLLPVLEGLLRHGRLSIRGLVDSGLISYCLIALASARADVRACAYSSLQSILELLASAPKTDPGTLVLPVR